MERGGRQSKNPELYWNANRSDAAAVCIASVLTVLIHALIFWVVPFDIARPKEPPRGDLEIAFEKPQFDRRLPDTVEANPFANDDAPPPDAPESFMNQRAADEVTDPDSKSKMPYVEGEIKNGRKIVQGTSSPENAYVAAREVLETLNRPLAQPARPSEVREETPPPQPERAADSSERSAEDGKAAQAAARAGAEMARKDSENSGDSGAQGVSGAPGEQGAAGAPGESGSAADGLKNAGIAAEKNAADSSGARDGLPAEPQESESVFVSAPLDSPVAPNVSAPERGGADSEASADSAQKKSGGASKKDSQKNSSGERLSQNTDESARGGAQNPGEPSRTLAKTSERGPVPEPAREPESAAEPTPASEPEPLPKPAPRPSLSMKIPAGPLADNRVRASRQGTLAVDSRFSEFGAYQQRMIEAISRQWNLLGAQYDLVSAIGSQTVIEFRLNTRGELTRLEVLFSNSTNLGRGLCEQSILTTAPYGEWTSEMVSVLGSRDCPVRITFYYR